MMEHTLELPQAVLEILNRLNQRGFTGYLVGGCVRDSLLGKEPADWDFCTNARPDELLDCFSDCKTVQVGKAYGTIRILWRNFWYELTTFRTEQNYRDARHPEEIAFSSSLYADLKRRDFTMNAMAYHPDSGLCDPFQGLEDLQSGRICCVGEPEKRFREDALRILRALRFASVYDFSLSEEVSRAVFRCSPLLGSISEERIQSEWTKLLCGKACGSILQKYAGLFWNRYPILQQADVFPASWERIFQQLQRVPPLPRLRLAKFCQPLQETSRLFLEQLRFSKREVSEILDRVRLLQESVSTDQRDFLDKLRRFGAEAVLDWLQIQLACSEDEDCSKRILLARNQVKKIIADTVCYTRSDLQLSGNDLLRLGFREGPAVGVALEQLLQAVMRGEIPNERTELLRYANLSLFGNS